MVDRSFGRQLGTVLLNLLVALGGVLTAAPLVWMFSASFKPLNEIYKYPPSILPETVRLDNYTRVFTDWPFARWYGNSLFVAILLTIAVLFFTSLAGFAFAKYRFKGSKALFIL
jgi:ABC-type glycerol-3-phosphate transport system permease component